VGRPLWREDGSVFCICCWPLLAQSVSGPSLLVLATIFYCLRYETSLFVASYDSQGHGGGIRPRLHTGTSQFPFPYSLISSRHRPRTETQPLYCWLAQTTQKTRDTCQTASSLVRYKHWGWHGRHRKQSLIYCCVLDRVYRAVAWQSVDQVRYNIIISIKIDTNIMLNIIHRSIFHIREVSRIKSTPSSAYLMSLYQQNFRAYHKKFYVGKFCDCRLKIGMCERSFET
jgi:hypothetical protein